MLKNVMAYLNYNDGIVVTSLSTVPDSDDGHYEEIQLTMPESMILHWAEEIKKNKERL